MEQAIPFAHSSRVSEKSNYDHISPYDQRQPAASCSTNFYADPNHIPEEYVHFSSHHNSKINYSPQQPEYNSETKFTDLSSTLENSHESTFCTEECTCESDSDESSNDDEPNDTEIAEEFVRDLYEEIIIEHCFQVHQAVKLGAFICDDEIEVPSQEPEDASTSSFVTCPNCYNKHDLKDYKVELGKCMRLTTRKSRRKTKPQPSFTEPPNDSFSSNGRKIIAGKKRKQQSKKGPPKNAKVRLQLEDNGYFPKEYCGQVTKSGTRCMKKPNCPAHKLQIKSVPMPELSYKPPQSFQEEFESTDIDVDTVEPTPYSWPASFSHYTPPLVDYSNSSNSFGVTRSEENGKIKMTIIKGDFKGDFQKKKKKKKPKYDSYSGHSINST